MNVDTGEIRAMAALSDAERASGRWAPIRGPARTAMAAALLAAQPDGPVYAPASGPLGEFRAAERRKAQKRKRQIVKASKRRNRRSA